MKTDQGLNQETLHLSVSVSTSPELSLLSLSRIFALACVTVWIFCFTFLLLIHTVSVQSVPVEGFTGETVHLPCSLGQKLQTVYWRYDDSKTVCDISGGKADFDEQHSAYKDRVKISQSEIEKGDFSITLSNVKESDSGLYTCIVPNSKTLTLELTVKGSRFVSSSR
ncbi:CD276 antigen homolog isoform X4 [Ictalurus punctatus]|uniref:CD276 antigen homolog isoform X4 n=1 Tax=Ictalurus punctatus TaxID=7998 RepID=A0A9F7TH45_ICTPU|nr:CD276 antigen homolog isoform X4 [Ictalurus punctatus]